MPDPALLCWAQTPGVRLRPMPELACCLAYVRDPPALHGLNLTSWIVLTLCDGRPEADIARAYLEAVSPVGGPGARRGALESALLQLETLRLIRRTSGPAYASGPIYEGAHPS